MPKYLIERQLPGAGSLSREKLEEVARKSVCVLDGMDPSIQWVESYVTPDALYCVYIAPNEEAIQEHGRRGSFPVTRITRIVGRFDPTTAEGPRRAE
jgi:Protein of unknown function (DUF4242)